MKLPIVGAAAAAFAAAALASAPLAFADAEQNFLATLEKGGFSWPDDAAGQVLVNAGHGVCNELDTGAPVADMITKGIADTGWSGSQVGYFIGAATNQFCPEHLQRVMSEAEALDG
jgi:hypothetical protein